MERTRSSGAKAWLLGGVCALGLFCLSLAACSSTLFPPVALAETPAHGITVPAEIRHGDQGATLVIVQVMIHGKGPYPMAIDTGASLTLIDQSLSDKLKLKPAGPSQQITGVGGVEEVSPISISQWSIGKAALPAMAITSAPLLDLKRTAHVDGLLGSDVFSRIGAITINYASGQVTFYSVARGIGFSIWSREAVA
jgi:hypothetical protein